MPGKTVRYRADVIEAMSLGTGDCPLRPDDPAPAWCPLAEGDSWFTVGAVPSSNLLCELHLKQRPVILHLGYPGHTIAIVAQLSAKDNGGDWRNEIHPNSGGYRKIAGRLAARLHRVLEP